MQTKTDLDLLRSKLLMAIKYDNDLDDKNSGLSYYAPKVSIGEESPISLSYSNGKVELDKKTIAEVTITKQVLYIDFHGRYDALLRNILTWLGVELHRFGASWVGYPNDDPLSISMTDLLLAKEEKIRLESLVAEKYSIVGQFSRGNPSTSATYITGLDTSSTSGWMNYYTAGGITGSMLINPSTMPRQTPFSWANEIRNEPVRRQVVPAPVSTSGNPPRDPRIRAALEAGMSQREIENITSGRGRR